MNSLTVLWFTVESVPDLGKHLTDEQKALWRAWIENLRGPVYRQCRKTLKQQTPSTGGQSFCCLGVVCDMVAGQLGIWEDPPLGDLTLTPRFRASSYSDSERLSIPRGYNIHYLPVLVAEYFGLPALLGFNVTGRNSGALESEVVPLATLNDRGFTFVQIADIIEFALNGGKEIEA